ncbi:hypothetical protein DAEQUDRAFT_729180 [Daedalea quercina L-15889]|uniref:DUF7330 domain-containing protein n=1 Tax=Daedalea quercina L-15889 TaxID=1314783 RepID=A0A165NSR6_9APHY|nr:hypothetical protein DAEQUDRAFT_729180 [Daedalea quercina L-15889]
MIITDSAPESKKQDVHHLHIENDEEPPPYDGPSLGFSTAGTPQPEPIQVPASVPIFQPTQQQCVNGLSLFSRHDAISGTYLVDPRLPSAAINCGNRGRSVEKAHAKNVRKAFGSVPGQDSSSSSDSGGWSRRSSRMPEVNAAFRTRHGPIKVNIGIINSALSAASTDGQRKACGRVMLSSRHGRINVHLIKIETGRCVDLDVSTRHGNITVFLPPTFNGSIAFRTRRGPSGISFLPAFASRARVLRGTDREMLVNLSSTPTADTSKQTAGQAGDDYCVIGTRHGKIAIGIYGVDTEADVVRSGGLAAQFEALMETGARQLETWLTVGAKALENSLQARRFAADNVRQTRARVISDPLLARLQGAPRTSISDNKARV